MIKTFKIYTLGCKVNQYDSNRLKEKFLSIGFNLVKNNANLAIVNTCSVTQTAVSKNKRMINRVKKENPNAKIILIGCWPKIAKKEAEKIGTDFVYGVGEIGKIIKRISNFKFPISKKVSNHKSQITKNIFANRSRYFLKIQDGCEQFCSYCIVPYTRGKLWSKPEVKIISEVKDAIKNGYEEIVLCGIHLGQYGKNIRIQISNIKLNLINLLKKIIKIKNLGRIRLSSIEITEIDNELINLIAKSNKICKHLHIPLQSGSDKILKLMRRPYNIKYYENKIQNIRKKIPNLALTTDVIVGFPQEDDFEFKKTYDFIKKIKFSRLHVFPYSVHKKTRASKLDGKIDEKEIKKRTKILREIGCSLSKSYQKKFRDKKLSLIIERELNKDEFIGKSEYYFDLKFNKKQIMNKSLKREVNLIGKNVEVLN